MLDTAAHFDSLYVEEGLAFGSSPDPELLEAIAGVPRGPVVDLGAGQGRHCLPLARMGFDVEVVDIAERGMRRLLEQTDTEGLSVSAVCCDVSRYVPPRGVAAVVAALLFHLPAEHVSARVARRIGAALQPGGVFYISLPGYDGERVRFTQQLLAAARCDVRAIVNHVVTRRERPRLPVPRRNETRAFGIRL